MSGEKVEFLNPWNVGNDIPGTGMTVYHINDRQMIASVLAPNKIWALAVLERIGQHWIVICPGAKRVLGWVTKNCPDLKSGIELALIQWRSDNGITSVD